MKFNKYKTICFQNYPLNVLDRNYKTFHLELRLGRWRGEGGRSGGNGGQKLLLSIPSSIWALPNEICYKLYGYSVFKKLAFLSFCVSFLQIQVYKIKLLPRLIEDAPRINKSALSTKPITSLITIQKQTTQNIKPPYRVG